MADAGLEVDIVNVFRPADEAPGIARDAARVGARVLWLQFGIESDEARAIAEADGLTVVMNRCLGVMHQLLGLGPGPHSDEWRRPRCPRRAGLRCAEHGDAAGSPRRRLPARVSPAGCSG